MCPDVEAGAVNMVRHLENLKKFGVNPVVAINVFADDTAAEIQAALREIALVSRRHRRRRRPALGGGWRWRS